MLILENIKLAFISLLANKMRALLTMLGIIIGIGSVIAIMTVSSSLTTSISNTFQEMGANNVTVGLKERSTSSETTQNGMKFGGMNKTASIDAEDRISDEMISELQTQMKDSIDAIETADTLIIGGTSLVVYPAAGFIRYFAGKHLVVINKSETRADSKAELVIRAPIGEIMSEAVDAL